MANLYPTGDAAKRSGVHSDTVRAYCTQGLLNPIRDSSGRRLFTDADIKRIREINQANRDKYPHLVGA